VYRQQFEQVEVDITKNNSSASDSLKKSQDKIRRLEKDKDILMEKISKDQIKKQLLIAQVQSLTEKLAAES